MTVDEVATRVRQHRTSIYRAVRDGRLEAYRIGEAGPLRIPRQALEQYLRPALKREDLVPAHLGLLEDTRSATTPGGTA